MEVALTKDDNVITKRYDLTEFTADPKSTTQAETLRRIDEDGIVIFPNFINKMELDGLNHEFEQLVKSKSRGISPFKLEKGEGVGINRKKFRTKDFPFTAKFFDQEGMHQLKDEYVHPTVDLNSKIYVVRDVPGTVTYAVELHFDVQKCLKFFIYLNDVSKENGAFEFVGRSHKWTEELRKSEQAKDITFENRELSRELPYKEEHVIPLEAKAGTLFIFDTDIFHRTGKTTQGERKIMRGHSYFDQAKSKGSLFKKTIR
ncbi:MAG: phytanoyl-CoA dioxygenase family protein [Vicingaceae bacterium]